MSEYFLQILPVFLSFPDHILKNGSIFVGEGDCPKHDDVVGWFLPYFIFHLLFYFLENCIKNSQTNKIIPLILIEFLTFP